MSKTITFISLAATLALVGCNDETSCPAVAEPAQTVAVVGTSAPAAAAPAPTPKRVEEKVAVEVKTPTRRVEAPVETVDADADLYVKRLVIARDVKDREPVAAATSFAAAKGKRIYAFVEVGNRDESASEVFVSFQPKGGEEGGRVRLRVGASPRWRTWAYTTQATDTGEWEAIVRNARGEVIGKQTFTVADLDESDPYANIDIEA